MTLPLDRAQLPITAQVAYLNTARHGPLPRLAADAVRTFLDEAALEVPDAWDRWDARHARLRGLGRRLMGAASTADVGLVRTTTQLMGVVAGGLRLGEGARVLVGADAFPTTRLVWEGLRADGVVVEAVAPDGWPAALSRPADVVVVEWVRTADGDRTDLAWLAGLAHGAGAVLVVDAIQGLGVVPARFAEWGVDAAGAAGFKWLLAPEGTGLAYLSPTLRARLRPVEPGWYSAWRGAPDGDGPPPALAFTEGGSPNSMGNVALEASVAWLLEARDEAIWAHVRRMCDRLVEGVADLPVRVTSPRADGRESAIVTLAVDDPAAVHHRLDRAGVAVTNRADGIRISPHGFSTTADIDRLLEALAG